MKPFLDDTIRTLFNNLESTRASSDVIDVKQLYGAFTMDTVIQVYRKTIWNAGSFLNYFVFILHIGCIWNQSGLLGGHEQSIDPYGSKIFLCGLVTEQHLHPRHSYDGT